MKTNEIEVIKTGMKVGAILGGIAFLVFGIVPGFHYGGYGALMLISKIAGGPVEATLAVRMVIVVGILIGIMCLGFMSIVIGSVLGTASGYMVHVLSYLKAPADEEHMIKTEK